MNSHRVVRYKYTVGKIEITYIHDSGYSSIEYTYTCSVCSSYLSEVLHRLPVRHVVFSLGILTHVFEEGADHLFNVPLLREIPRLGLVELDVGSDRKQKTEGTKVREEEEEVVGGGTGRVLCVLTMHC